MDRTFRRVVAACSLIAFCGPTLAAGFYCDGLITTVGLNSSLLYVGYGTVPIQSVCSVTGTVNGIPPETCRSWQALILSAQAQGRKVRFSYDSATSGNPASCAEFQTWAAAAPYLVITLD